MNFDAKKKSIVFLLIIGLLLVVPSANQQLNIFNEDLQTNSATEANIGEMDLENTPESSFSTTPNPATDGASWTFMVYVDADNNLEGAGINDVNEMEVVGSTAQVDIVVQIDRVDGYDTTNGDWETTKRYHIEKDTSQSTIGSSGTNLGEINMGSGTSLENFIDWSQTTYPADNYALILWDHGSGAMWGPYQGGICWDDTSNSDYLTESEVVSAIEGKNINLLGMDACLMAATEFEYALKDYVDVIVGSEKTEPGDGWPYDTILQWLIQNPSASATQLGEQIVQKYMASYPSTYQVTQSAVLTSQLNAVQSAISTLATTMTTSIGSYKASLESIRPVVQEYDDEPYIDMYDFADRVETNILNLATEAGAVKTAIENAVVENGYTSGLPGSHGLTIYFPETASDFSNTYRSNSFATISSWDEFLLAYYNAPIDDDQFEENDYFSEASSMVSGYYPGLICDDDDIYNISVSMGDLLTIQLVSTFISNVADLDIALFAENGSDIAISESTNDFESISWTADVDQTVSLWVKNYENGSMVSYTLTIFIPIDDDLYEDNDNFASATSLNSFINTTVQNLVCIDWDYYSFTALDNNLVTINLDYRASKGMLNLLIYGENETHYIIMDSVGSPDDNETYQFGTTETTWTDYYIVVVNYENNTNYNLTITIDSFADDEYDTGVNDNDYINTITYGTLSDGFYSDLVCFDNDFYNVSLTTGDWLNVSIYFTHSEGDLDIYLYDMHNYNLVAYSNYWEDNEMIIFECLESGEYSIRVDPYEINLNYNMSINTTQTFTNDIYDGNNDDWDQVEDFPAIEMDIWYENLTAWDQDYYAINLTAGDSMIFSIWFNGTEGTLVLFVYDSEGYLIDYSFTEAPNEFLQIDITSTETYYVRVLPLQRLETYDLFITEEPDVDLSIDLQHSNSLTLSFTELANDDALGVFFEGFSWNFGNGDQSGLANGTYIYSTSGTYTVTLYIYTNFGVYYSIHQEISIWATPTPLVISLNGTSPLTSNSFTISWDATNNAEYIGVYVETTNITDIEGLSAVLSDHTGTAIAADITVQANGIYYIVVMYSNPFGQALSNMIMVEINDPNITNNVQDQDQNIPGYPILGLMLFFGIGVTLLIVLQYRKRN